MMEKLIIRNLPKMNHAMTEAFRTIRTNIQFCGDDIKVILVTSTMPDEGKSTVCLNLARSLTEARKRVLIIDSDMRKSTYVAKLRMVSEAGEEIYGLSHYLSGQKGLGEVLYSTSVGGLCMVLAGPSVPNPTEILEKQYFSKLLDFAREHFDYILIDCAPLTAAIDAAAIAKNCDGAVYVVAQGQVNNQVIVSSIRQLEASGIKILGGILNKVNMKKAGYGNYYGKYYGKYYSKGYGSYGDEADNL